MRSKAVAILSALAAAGSIACINSNEPTTQRAADRLSERRTVGGEVLSRRDEEKAARAKVLGAKTEIAEASIAGTVAGEAKVFRELDRGTVAVDVTSAPHGHYEALLADALGCKFDPNERFGGAVDESKPEPAPNQPLATGDGKPRGTHAVGAGRTMSLNPFSIGEINIEDHHGHIETTFALKDLAINPATGLRDKVILIRKAGPAPKESVPVTTEVLGCGRFTNVSEEPQG